MPLSPNEIKERAVAFAHKWAGEDSERAEAQSFWNDFFHVFGLDRKRVAVFEKQVKLARAGERLKQGRIDLFWKGTLLVEHKSAGADLDRAFAQAADYFDGLAERDLPRHILVSDFARSRSMPPVRQRVERVKTFRLASKRKDTQKLAEYPTRLAFVSQPRKAYPIMSGVSSEPRPYLPLRPLPPIHQPAARREGSARPEMARHLPCSHNRHRM